MQDDKRVSRRIGKHHDGALSSLESPKEYPLLMFKVLIICGKGKRAKYISSATWP